MASKAIIGSQSGHGSHHGSQHGSEVLENDFFGIENSASDSEIMGLIRTFASSYTDSSSLQILNNRITSSINAIHILHDVKPNDKIEDVGHRLFINLKDLFQAVDVNIFPIIIINDFNLTSNIQKHRETRAQIQADLNSAKARAEIVLSEPKIQNFDLATEVEIYDLTENVRNAKIAAVSTLVYPSVFSAEEMQKIEDAVQEEILPQIPKIKMDSRKRFLAANAHYEVELQKKNLAIVELRDHEQELKRATALEGVLEAFSGAERNIYNRVVAEVTKKYPLLIPTLKGSMKHPITGAEINTPWEKRHLAGITSMVYDHFHKNKFINFNNSLLEVMAYSISAEETKTNPMQAVTKIRDYMFKWEQQKLWKQFTPDHFWTANLLRALDPKSPIRYEVLKKTHEKIREFEPSSANGSSQPIFDFAAECIASAQQSKKFISGLDHVGKGENNSSKPPMHPNNTPRHNPKYPPHGMEQAAAASVAVTSPGPSASPSGPEVRANGKTIYQHPAKVFNTSVSKDKLIYIANQTDRTKHPHVYQAVSSPAHICPRCFNADGSPASSPCTPKPCKLRQCHKCGYYGHLDNTCLQSHSSSGVAI